MSGTTSAPRTFDELQRSMADRLGRRGISDLSSGTIVVFPSLTFPPDELVKIIGIEHYEERMLCMTLLLRRPTLDIVYVSSVAIDAAVIDYYLSFISDVDDARDRLHLVALDDASPRPLSEKIFEHPDAVAQIKSSVSEVDNAFLFPFNVTEFERRLSEELSIPVYGPSPALAALGSKSGSRHVGVVAGVPIAPGAADLRSLEEVEHAAFDLVARVPDCEAVVIKLNNGFSGQGNVTIDRRDLTSPISSTPATFCAQEESWASLATKIERDGAVVEHLMRETIASPSAQLRIFGDGEYEVVSTHDQILGGPDAQVYVGCRFPADDAYRQTIQAYGLGIARELASRGVIGSFGVDFIVLPDERIFLSEINLRLGGTTHPFLMARFLTQGVYDVTTGELRVGDESRVYVGTDNIKSPSLAGRSPADLVATLERAGIAFDPRSNSGVALHLLGAAKVYGKLGALCLGRDGAEAEDFYVRLLESLGV